MGEGEKRDRVRQTDKQSGTQTVNRLTPRCASAEKKRRKWIKLKHIIKQN